MFFLNFWKFFQTFWKFFASIFLLFVNISSVFAQNWNPDNQAWGIGAGTSFYITVADLDPITKTKVDDYGATAFHNILEKISDFLLMLSPLIAAVALIIAGYYYIFSGADQDNLNKAKTIIKWNLLAVLVAFLSGGIIRIVAGLLG